MSNVSSVKNLNGEVFSAIQDASLTDYINSNSSIWSEITGVSSTYSTTGDLNATSGILSAAIDYVSANAGTTYTGVYPIVVTGDTISADSFDLTIGSGLAFENNTLYVSAESVPEGVMVESACEYNAVNEISGYNGSAIAQYGAEKQWLVHDDTLVHVANSAQYALGVNVSALQRLMGIDETVLYSGAATNNGSLNESVENFDTIKVNYITDDGMQGVTEFMPSYTKSISLDSMYVAQNSAVWFKATNYTFSSNTSFNSYPYQLFKSNNTITATWSNNTNNSTFRITRVIGIGRKQ